jgi:hypothetical protein
VCVLREFGPSPGGGCRQSNSSHRAIHPAPRRRTISGRRKGRQTTRGPVACFPTRRSGPVLTRADHLVEQDNLGSTVDGWAAWESWKATVVASCWRGTYARLWQPYEIMRRCPLRSSGRASLAAALWLSDRGKVVGVSNTRTSHARSRRCLRAQRRQSTADHRNRNCGWSTSSTRRTAVARGQVRLQNLTNHRLL